MATNYNKDAPGSTWVEPPSDYKGEFPYNNITQSESGHLFELDDSPGQERIRLQHGKTGTYTELRADGGKVTKIFGDDFEIVVNNKNVLISGRCNISIEGDYQLNIQGDVYQKVQGSIYQSVDGDVNISSENGEVTINSDSDINLISEKAVDVYASDGVRVHGDLFVSGNINTSQSLNATKNVTAGMKVLGTLGIDTLAGINAGFTTPGPNAPGVITAAVSMNAPFGNFITMKAVLMTDMVNSKIYSSHIHISPKGPTSPPIIPMI